MTLRSPFHLVAALLLACPPSSMAAGPAVAQPEAPAPAQEESAGTRVSRAMAARAMARLAVLDLRLAGEPDDRDLAINAELLELAHRLSPDDEQILRLLLEACAATSDQERTLRHTRRLLEINPDDTVAQLRLISGGIGRWQDAGARLSWYERFIARESLHTSVRSRLALDAAMLYREQGDLAAFADRLNLAVGLDSTNKDAASMAVAFVTPTLEDPVARLDLLLNLLLADPFDPSVHLAIARELAAGGAFIGADRFYATFRNLQQARGERMPDAVLAESYLIGWNVSGAEVIVRTLRMLIEQQRLAAADAIRAAEAAGEPTGELPRPDDQRLSVTMERVRLMAATVMEDPSHLANASADYGETIRLVLEALDDPAKRPKQVTEDQLRRQILRLRSDATWLRLWAGFQIDEAASTLAWLAEQPEVLEEPLERFRGWLHLREGNLDEAERILTPLSADDPLARLGLGALAQQRGESSRAAAIFTALAHEQPGTLAGTWCRAAARRLTREPVPPAVHASGLEARASSVGDWLERYVSNPRQMMSIRAEVLTPKVSTFSKPMVRIELQNVSEIPMALGPEAPINSRLLLVPQLDIGVNRMQQFAEPMVVNADRRLRLEPRGVSEAGSAVTVDVWPTVGLLGWLLDEVSGRSARVRWRVVQGFRLAEGGGFEAGPQSLSTEVARACTRRPMAMATRNAEEIERWIRTGSLAELCEGLVALRYACTQQQDGVAVVNGEDRMRIGAVIGERFEDMEPVGKMLVLCLAPPNGAVPWMQPLNDAAADETDPDVLRLAMVTRIVDPAHPVFDRLIGGEDASLATFARLCRERLEAGRRTFGNAMAPPPSPTGLSQPGRPVQPR